MELGRDSDTGGQVTIIQQDLVIYNFISLLRDLKLWILCLLITGEVCS